jgi:hypothetical protein
MNPPLPRVPKCGLRFALRRQPALLVVGFDILGRLPCAVPCNPGQGVRKVKDEAAERGDGTGAGSQTCDQTMEAGQCLEKQPSCRSAMRTTGDIRPSGSRDIICPERFAQDAHPLISGAAQRTNLRQAGLLARSVAKLVEVSRLFPVTTFGIFHPHRGELDQDKPLRDIMVIPDEADAQLLESGGNLMKRIHSARSPGRGKVRFREAFHWPAGKARVPPKRISGTPPLPPFPISLFARATPHYNALIINPYRFGPCRREPRIS